MLDRIRESLSRQNRGLELLRLLQEEEFSRLKSLNPKGVTEMEFSIQELIRQLAAEREWVKTLAGGRRLSEMLDELRGVMPEKTGPIEELWKAIDSKEQQCAIQAEHTTALALALMDQNQTMLEFLHSKVTPKKQDAYTAKGRMNHHDKPEATILRGRL